jgi:hypothetical protein
VAKERRSGEELRQMMLAAARQHEEYEEPYLDPRHGLMPIGVLAS